MTTLHFKTSEGYQKWLAYQRLRTKTGLSTLAKDSRKSISYIEHHTKGHKYPKVMIAGKPHKVLHQL